MASRTKVGVVLFVFLMGLGESSLVIAQTPGEVDATFAPTVNGGVTAIVLQSDGKPVIGGFFTTVNGTTRRRVARLEINGNLDERFNPGTGITGSDPEVWALALQPDGKVVVGGFFTGVNGTNRSRLARLNTNGSLDLTFDPSTNAGLYGGIVYAIAVQTNSNVIVGGDFEPNLNLRYGVVRMGTNGILDSSFVRSEATYVEAVVPLANGQILIGGEFTSVNGVSSGPLARLNASGAVDIGFSAGVSGSGPAVFAVVTQTDGKIVIGGRFDYVGGFSGTSRKNVARLNADGTVDSSFNPGSGANGDVRALALQTNGKILTGGSFTSFNGTNCNRIARLNTDGSLDATFDPGSGANNTVECIAVQSDGSILIGGQFDTVNNSAQPNLARLFGESSALPTLTLGRSNATAVLSWPSSATGFILEEIAALGATNWSSVAQTSSIEGNRKIVTVPMVMDNRFFRLRLQ